MKFVHFEKGKKLIFLCLLAFTRINDNCLENIHDMEL